MKRKLLLLAAVPLAALLLSACSSKQAATNQSQNAANQQSVSSSPSEDSTNTVAQPQLEPLPSDDKQAIDTELDNINKDLNTTDNSVKSTDLSSANLGL